MATAKRSDAQVKSAQAIHDHALAMGAKCEATKMAKIVSAQLRKGPQDASPSTSAPVVDSAGYQTTIRTPVKTDGKPLEQGQNDATAPPPQQGKNRAGGNANDTAIRDFSPADVQVAQGIHDAVKALGAVCMTDEEAVKAMLADPDAPHALMKMALSRPQLAGVRS